MLTPRKKAFKDPFDYSILIVCEDSKSSVYYFEEKLKECNISNSVQLEKAITKGNSATEGVVDIDGGSDSAPTSVVEYAIEKRDEYNTVAKKKGIFPYKTVYCVIDVDNHNDNNNNLDKAITLIEEDKATLEKSNLLGELIPIITNECFELWYVLHFIEYSTKTLHRPRKGQKHEDDERLDKILEQYLGKEYEKGDENILQLIHKANGNETKAIGHSKKLLDFHITNLELDGDERAYYQNPSTKVHQIIELLNRLKERRDADEAEDFADFTLSQVLQKISGNSTENTRLLLAANDTFPTEIVGLINKLYKKETQARKIDLFLDLFDNPWSNTTCAEFPEEIASFFYSEYQNWKNSIQD